MKFVSRVLSPTLDLQENTHEKMILMECYKKKPPQEKRIRITNYHLPERTKLEDKINIKIYFEQAKQNIRYLYL